jgi:NAD(P)-dependent dehydrogenase (short-subunit alcohol dehydrogenase family)
MNDKIALVTGGSRGLGKSSALALAQKGVDVIVTYNSQKEKADTVVKEIEGKRQESHGAAIGRKVMYRRMVSSCLCCQIH